ncbi:CotO family spore coat protein [Neobacillus rhizosphaerae]|uniref:CotO family spore coat protein n=1 Tax=Neobacillus rhizosphaerae TaxID=2880965 RepID=UPI003D2E3365
MSTKKNQGPLLYVYQPFSRTPSNTSMQEIFISKGEPKELKEEIQIEIESKNKISLAKKEIVQEAETKKEATLPSSNNLHQQEPKPSFKRVKPFKELDIKERLDYLINFPKVLPPVPCVFYTKEENYTGYLTAYDDGQITIQFHDQSTIDIPLVELKDIIMIGIKR